jgi:hypothetical protein
LSCHHDRAVVSGHDDGLMAGGMSGSRNHEDPGQHLSFPIELLVAQARRVKELRQRVVRGRSRCLELHTLREDRSTRELGIATAVLEVEVTVDHQLDILPVSTGSGDGGVQGPAFRAVVGIDFRVAPHSGTAEGLVSTRLVVSSGSL